VSELKKKKLSLSERALLIGRDNANRKRKKEFEIEQVSGKTPILDPYREERKKESYLRTTDTQSY